MHEKTRETLADINHIERERRKHLVDRVVSFIGREFRRQFPKSTLSIVFHPGNEDVRVDGEYIDATRVASAFIGAYLRDAREITDDYERVLPDDLLVEPGTNKSEVAVAAFENLDVSDAEKAHGDADDILLNYLRDTGHMRIVDAYDAVVERAGGFWYS